MECDFLEVVCHKGSFRNLEIRALEDVQFRSVFGV